MSSEQDTDYELLTEHLGYPPVSLLDDVINTVNVLADRALDSVERLLTTIPPKNLGFVAPKSSSSSSQSQQPPPEEAAKLEIETGTHKLETLLTASIDRNFDKLELYTMQNILTVQPRDLRPHIRLAHYAGLEFPSEEGDDGQQQQDRPTTESVTALRRRVQASQKLNVELQRERDRNEVLLRSLREVLGVGVDGVKKENDAGDSVDPEPTSTFGFLGKGRMALSSIGSDTPLTTTTQFTLSQLQSLRSLSGSLRTMLPELEAAAAAAAATEEGKTSEAAGKRNWRRERAEYVEAASRKYLENTGGLELGTQGEVRDGEYQGQGRNMNKGDVEGLERVAAMLGNGAEPTRQNDNTTSGGDGEEPA